MKPIFNRVAKTLKEENENSVIHNFDVTHCAEIPTLILFLLSLTKTEPNFITKFPHCPGQRGIKLCKTKSNAVLHPYSSESNSVLSKTSPSKTQSYP